MSVQEPVEAHQVDLGDLLALIWQGKWIVLISAILLAIIAAVVSLQMANVYRSEVTLKPAVTDNGQLSGMSGLASLAPLAGLNLGGQSVTQADEAIAVLRSRQFLVDFARKHELVVPLMAGQEWDNDRQALALNPEIYDIKAKQWTRAAELPFTGEPLDEEIYLKLRSIIDVERDATTGLVSLNVTFLSPDYAQKWAALLVQELNAEIRKRRLGEMDRALQYLEERIRANTIVRMQSPLEQFYLSQLQQRLLAQARDEFALETLDPANRPIFKHGPNRTLIVLVAGTLGAIIGMIAVVVIATLGPRIKLLKK